MGSKVNIRLETDPSCREPEVIIRADQQSPLIDSIISAIERCAENKYPTVAVYRGDTLVLLDPDEIIRVYTENRKLMIHADSGAYETRRSLKDLETMLSGKHFVRISRFEIVNLSKVTGFDFSTAGTVRVIFSDNSETWAARRYLQTLRQALKDIRPGKEG